MSGALVAPSDLDIESFARAAHLHPDLVRRFVALGLIEPTAGARGDLRFRPSQLRSVARIQRLRAGFALNYASLSLVIDLLDRIAELEAAGRQAPRTTGERPWT
ncbi:MAG TPA: chaperone modulator CbpM [Acidimicrobiales bacterium]|jgi:pimeloyl-ACP methyl ester carboxylesterase|nr:chaperone modulator CbpM [Acidimicrobiales bacterium]